MRTKNEDSLSGCAKPEKCIMKPACKKKVVKSSVTLDRIATNPDVSMYHLTTSYTSHAGMRSAVWAFEYAFRILSGKHAGDTVRGAINLHMPSWVGSNASEDGGVYWKAAEAWSRKNARTAYKIEFALPRELSKVDQSLLASLMIDRIIEISVSGKYGRGNIVSGSGGTQKRGGQLPVSYAIHEGLKALRVEPNPHVHAVVSTSVTDQHDRHPHTWFARWNPSQPKFGGARKSLHMGSKKWLHMLRKAWSELANAFLMSRGLPARLDHRSYSTRKLQKRPTCHLGNRSIKMAEKGHFTTEYMRNLEVEEFNLNIDVQRRLRFRKRLKDRELQRVEEDRKLQLQAEALLDEHVLSFTDRTRSLESATLLVHSSVNNSASLSVLFSDPGFFDEVTKAAGPGFAVFKTKTGIWILNPSSNDVALVKEVLIATDSLALDMLDLVRRVAEVIAFEGPVVRAKSEVPQVALDLFSLDRYAFDQLTGKTAISRPPA